jgi:hypothetical protein
MVYLLDANVFIQAKNFYYGFDICPGFWEWSDDAFALHDVCSITKVYDELVDGNDELAEWIGNRKGNGRFISVSDLETQTIFRSVAAHVQNGQFQVSAKSKFLAKADPWLVAKAKAVNAVVVTHEQAAPDALKRVPLPDICDAFSVPYINIFELLRRTHASFGLL